MIIYIILLFIFILMIIYSANIVRGGVKYSDNYLSKDSTQWLKGAAAILIIFHHLAQQITLPTVFTIMEYIGFILVAVFFFLSGYGLMYGFNHKDNYLKGFLLKKLLRLYISYWVVITVKVCWDAISGTIYSINDYILTYLGFDTIAGLWFVTAIILMYLFFWISFRISRQYGILILAGLTIIYSCLCLFFNLLSSYTASIFVFVFGAGWMWIDESWKQWIRRRYPIKLILSIVLFCALFAGRLVLAYVGIDNEILHFVLRNIIGIAFVFALIALAQKIELKRGILNQAGKISYELYIVHFVLLTMLSGLKFEQNLYVCIVIICTVFISFLLYWCCDKVRIIGLKKK